MTPVLLGEVVAKPFCFYRGRAAAQAIILRELIDRSQASVERLIDCVWGDDEDGGPLLAHRIIHLHIFNLRNRLRPGWHIINHHGRGYELVYEEPTEIRIAA